MENIPYNRRVKFHGCLLRIDGAKISSVWGRLNHGTKELMARN